MIAKSYETGIEIIGVWKRSVPPWSNFTNKSQHTKKDNSKRNKREEIYLLRELGEEEKYTQ